MWKCQIYAIQTFVGILLQPFCTLILQEVPSFAQRIGHHGRMDRNTTTKITTTKKPTIWSKANSNVHSGKLKKSSVFELQILCLNLNSAQCILNIFDLVCNVFLSKSKKNKINKKNIQMVDPGWQTAAD